jgi:hypothetical protein
VDLIITGIWGSQQQSPQLARADAKDKRRDARKQRTATASSCSRTLNSAQLFFEENIGGDDATGQLQAAKKDPPQFVIKPLSDLQSKQKQMDDSLACKRQIRELEQGSLAYKRHIRELEQVSGGHERHIIALKTLVVEQVPMGPHAFYN